MARIGNAAREAIEVAEREVRLAQKRKRPVPAQPVSQPKRTLRPGDKVTIQTPKGQVTYTIELVH